MRVAFACLLLAASLALEAAERSYAVLPLVGDKLLIARAQMATGSRLNRNVQQYVSLESDALDRTAARAARAALQRADPGAKVELLGGDATLFAVANGALAADAGPALAAALKPALQGLGVTHWLIVSKFKGEARAKLREGTVGTGQVEGLGFYIETERNIIDVDTGEGSQGFVAPFAYLRYTLVDAVTGEVVAEEKEIETTTVIKQTATHPWDALTPEAKVRHLERLIQAATDDAVGKLLRR